MCLLFQLHTDVLLGQDNVFLMGFYISVSGSLYCGNVLKSSIQFFSGRGALYCVNCCALQNIEKRVIVY
jgi:hypothetical protein